MLSIHTSHPVHPTRRGVALLAVVPVLVVLVVLVVAIVGSTVDSSRWNERRIDLYSVRASAEAATQLAVESIWSDFEASRAGGAATVNDSRVFLDNIGIRNQSTAGTPADVELLPTLALAADPNGEAVIGGTVIESVRVRRMDDLRSTRLEFSTTAVARRGDERFDAASTRHTVQDVFVIEPPVFEGLDFVLLANNINCIMCHTSIDNVDRVYSTNESLRGTYERVKTGSIESFLFRSDPESSLAGTLYLGGGAHDEHGAAITNWDSFSFEGHSFDGGGYIREGVGGTLTTGHLVPSDPLNPQPLGNLYLDYFAHEGDVGRYQVDGVMPKTFPLPFPDDGGLDPSTLLPTPGGADNRVVDDNEFAASVANVNGRASGGNIRLLPHGTVVDTGGELAALQAGNDQLMGVADGNVYMHGTEANPVRLSGDLAISGDLILSGVVLGSASIKVRGNVYVTGDLVYADAAPAGNRTFGRAADGTANLLTIASGNNIVIGDMYHPAWGGGPPTNGRSDGSWNFTLDEVAIFNRMEWMKTQPTLPGQRVSEVVRLEDRQRELFETVQVTTDEPVRVWRGTGVFVDQPIFVQRGTGVFDDVPIYERQQTGTRDVPIYRTIVHPANPPEPYGSPWTERVIDGYTTEPVFANVQVGTRRVERRAPVQVGTRPVQVFGWVQTGTRSVTRDVTRSFAPRRYETYQVEIFDWVTPQHPNPHYAGLEFLPRYYAFADGAPVPIFDKTGYYDPRTEIWVAPERPGSWDPSQVTFADPNDPTDPYLFGPMGTPKAVVSTLTPTAGWITDALLRSITEANLAARDAAEPLAVDAWLYSANSVFGVVPARNSAGVSGKMRINGAVIAADVGLLAPNGMQINFDERGRSRLDVRSQTRLVIRRQLWAPGSRERESAIVTSRTD